MNPTLTFLRLACTVAVALAAAPALAATITVDTTDEGSADPTNCTLRDAINAANTDLGVNACTAGSGDDVIIVPAGTYNVTDSTLTAVTTGITVQGAGMHQTFLVGDGNNRAFRSNAGANLVIEDLHVSGFSGQYGGAFYNNNGSMTLRRVACIGNVGSANGGCISVENIATVEDSVLADNSAQNGGAIELHGGNLTVVGTVLSGNTATNHAGGVIVGGSGSTFSLNRSLVAQNQATNNGGGLYEDASGATHVIRNSTFSGNHCNNNGGGIFTQGITTLAHVTVTQNSAGNTAGGVRRDAGAWTVVSSIIAGNSAPTNPDCSIASVNNDLNNIIGDATGCGGFGAADNFLNVDPQLGPLTDLGGGTLVHEPGFLSPAQGAADCLDGAGGAVTEDQRGWPRPTSDLCTIGAMETGIPFQVLIETTDIAAGATCAAGGFELSYGLDMDHDGVLDTEEVSQTETICNGEDGTNGTNGTNGTDGADGSNGTDGADGIDGVDGVDGADGADGMSPSTVTTALGAGESGCASGGWLVTMFYDLNGDDMVDAGETVLETLVLCNGADGADGADGLDGTDGADGTPGTDGTDGADGTNGTNGLNALVNIEDILPGEVCAAGGVSIESGLDLNGDETLEESEVTDSSVVCNGETGTDGQNGSDGADGQDGADGSNALVNVMPAGPESPCEFGGLVVESGADLDGSGTLEPEEVTNTQHLCNTPPGQDGQDGQDGADGADGLDSLITLTPEPAGDNCEFGGQMVQVGLDTSGDGMLDSDEVTATDFVCNAASGADGADGADGLNGADGADGSNALVSSSPEPAGDNCEFGGYALAFGLDVDGDGTLSEDETSVVEYVCNGADGADGATGIDGTDGVDGAAGADGQDGANGQDGAAGADGAAALVSTTAEPAGEQCAAGGIRVDAGIDADGDGQLSEAEISSTSYLCNGADGADGLNGADGTGCSGGSGSTGWLALLAFGALLWRRRVPAF